MEGTISQVGIPCLRYNRQTLFPQQRANPLGQKFLLTIDQLYRFACIELFSA